MGKDKVKAKTSLPAVLPHHSSLKTKETLQKDNRKYHARLSELEHRYDEIRNVVRSLEAEYKRSKELSPPARYNELKNMIKRCTSDLILEKAKPPTAEEIKLASKQQLAGLTSKAADFSGATSRSQSRTVQPGKQGLLAACKQFAAASDSSHQEKAASVPDFGSTHLSKKEVASDIELTKNKIATYDAKFLRAHNRLVKLKQDYEESKAFAFTTRYSLMKDMIKTVITDHKLLS